MTLAPDKDEARHVLEFIKANRQRTREWFASILENRGIGSFKQDDKRPFNRNLLFNKNEAGSVTQVYLPSWLDEIKRCHLPLWSLADDDPAVGDLNNYILTFKHEWEDFFQTLSSRFPDRADNLISDFEYAGLEMFGNLENSIISGSAQTPDAELNHDVFHDYLPEVKKLFVKEKLLSASENEDNNPLVKKYIAWGAKDKSDIPRHCLKICESDVPKDLFEKNLNVKAKTGDQLLKTLNKNVDDYMDAAWQNLYDTMDDCYHNGYITNLDPIGILCEDITKGDSTSFGFKRSANWTNLLAATLSMPRLTLHYYWWANFDEGPTEPGLRYDLANGSEEEVYYEAGASKWDDQIRDLEDFISEAISSITQTLEENENLLLLNEWAELSQSWDACFDPTLRRHCIGDLCGFSSKFYKSWTKLRKHQKLLESVPAFKITENAIGENKADEIVSKIATKIDQSSGELKAHVTAETDRGIAAKVPKRKRKYGELGKGSRGPKTEMMEKQRKAFIEFLKKYPEELGVKGKTRISRANQCWQKHPEWEKAKTATGKNKGYANHKSLAQAK